MNKKTQLDSLRDKHLVSYKSDIDSGVSLTFSNDAVLSVFNTHTLYGAASPGLGDLIGKAVVETEEREFDAQIVFEDDLRLEIDLSEDAYKEVEGMVLFLPDKHIVVWCLGD